MRYAILLTTASLGASIGWSLGESAGTGLSILLGLAGFAVGWPLGERFWQWTQD